MVFARPGFRSSAADVNPANSGAQAAWPRSLARARGNPSAARCSWARPVPASRQWATLGRRTDSPDRNVTMAQGLPRTVFST